MSIYYAHSSPYNSPLPEGNKKDWHLLKTHLLDVGNDAAEKAALWGSQDEATLAGLLHDLGKYSNNFQKRLDGKMSGINHWSQGAIIAWEHQAWLAAFAIYGHHVGLPSVSLLRQLGKNPEDECRTWNISEPVTQLKNRFESDGLSLQTIRPTTIPIKEKPRFAMAVRMLFSALCDADFIDTEAHFNQYLLEQSRPSAPDLQAKKALKILLDHIHKKAKPTDSKAQVVYEARQSVLKDCLNKAELDERLFTLTAPTGSGKTFSSVAFALKHAVRRGLRRIIIVIPYLSIIEQTAKELRDIFGPVFGEDYILEHHSMADRSQTENNSSEEKDAEEEVERNRRLLAQNWDAPLIITTSVQFFESLFADQSTRCRKLHNIANSVVYFDEAQTLPPHLAIATLETLNALMQDYGVTVVFGTATQPAFKSLSQSILGGWRPKEILSDPEKTFSSLKRVRPIWPGSGTEKMEWPEIAETLCGHKQALCIVNLKKHAAELSETMRGILPPEEQKSLFHLSTALCPAHRKAILEEVRAKLQNKERVYLIATQCIEAGVDIDFPVVWRAMAPLEALAQAFGRCNREGRLEPEDCEARIFIPVDANIPMPDYEQATSIARTYFWEEDLQSQKVFDKYFKKLYSNISIQGGGGLKQQALEKAVKQLDFPEIAKNYRLIESDTVSVVVPYKKGKGICREFEQKGLQVKTLRALMHKAQPYVVNIYRNQLLWNQEIKSSVIPIPGVPGGGWYLWNRPYDEKKHMGIFTKALNEILYV